MSHRASRSSSIACNAQANPPGETLAMQDLSGGQNHTPAALTNNSKSLLQLSIVLASLCAAVFVAALDITIITTSLPAIAGHFHSSSGYTWIGSAYILANSATIPSWGKLSDIWGRKPLLLVALAIFFAGSLVCATGDNMPLFLFGRAVQGLGAAGLLTLVNICVCDLFSMRDRGLYFGLISLIWAVACGVAPVLGGILTEKASWRWCFWINLPISGVVFLLLLFKLKLETPKTPLWAGLKAVDWTGSLFIVGSTIMLLLGLDFGGVTHPWDSATVLCLIIFSAVTIALFVLNEWKLVKYPIIPLVLFSDKSGVASFLVCFCHGFIFLGQSYYLPLYFQGVLGASPIMSGVYLLPLVVSISIFAAMTGVYIQKTGKYIPAMWVGLVLLTLGVGLLINLDPTLNWGKIVGYQIITGAGVGLNFEGPLLALQAVVGLENTATATASIGFVRSLSSAVSVVIGAVVFQNQMTQEGPKLVAALGKELATRLADGGATANIELINSLPAGPKAAAQQAFHRSLRTMWIMYVAFAVAGLVAGFFVDAHHLSKGHETVTLGLRGEQHVHNEAQEEHVM